MEEDRRFPAWVLPVLGVAVVVGLVLIGLNRAAVEFDPGTPEGTVQLYVAALVEGDYETAGGYWADESCRPSSIVPTMSTDVSASLVGVDGNERQATVRVNLSENSEGSMGGIYVHEEWFDLVNGAEGWRIRQPSWPYYDQICEESA
jgi:hypothetical protein